MMDMQGEDGRKADHFSQHGEMVARKFYVIVGMFVAIVVCIMVLDRFQAYMLESVRSYVAGEGYWSKGQKDGVYHLARYASSYDEADYQQFLQGLSISLADRQARQALQQDPPDLDSARQGFLGGRNHRDDIPRMISFFLHFSHIGPMKTAIAIWTKADEQIDLLRHLGELLHEEVGIRHPVQARIRKIMDQIDLVNARVTGLEYRFSDTLEKAMHQVSRIAAMVINGSSLLLLLIGIVLSRQIVRGIRRTGTALADSEARFRHVFESNIVGIMFCGADGDIFDANDAFLTIVGHPRSDLAKGLNLHALTPEDSRDRDDKTLREVRKKGHCLPYEKEFLHKDGHRVAAYMGVAYLDGPEENNVCFVLDISEHRRAAQLQRLATAVFHAAAEAIFVIDSSPAIKAVNPAFSHITGYAPEEILGKNPSLLGIEQYGSEFYRRIWRELKTSGSWKGEVHSRRKNGETFLGWLSISAIRDDRGEVSEYVGVFNDITEQRQMEERLNQAHKMEAIVTLVGGIAHDFNNTLAAVQGNLYLAKKYNADNPRVADKLNVIEKLSTHSAEIVQQLLTFARKGIVRMTPVSLNGFFGRLQQIATPIMPKGTVLDMQVCDEELTIMGDVEQLQRVMQHLLRNACDAVADSDDKRISCRLERCIPNKSLRKKHPELPDAPLAHVVISDNGRGIPADEMEHIFEPFYTTKGVGKGTGLGMSMVFGSMQTHHGIVEVQSTLGQGTSVHLYLPLAEPEVRQQIAEPSAEPAAADQQRIVLLVDDDFNILSVCSEVLDALGYQVLTAADGEEAMESFAKHRDGIDLVVTDIVMPKIGGFAMVEQMRRQRPHLPVIFMTGFDPQRVTVPENLAQNSVILTKPFPVDMLATQVRQMISGEA